MSGRPHRPLLFAALALLAVPVLGFRSANAQERFRVLIPDFFPLNDANKNFGERVAEDLRELMQGIATHTAIEEGEIKDELKRLDLKMEDLDCIKTRQLGSQMNAQVAVCAFYTEVGDQRSVSQIEVWDLGSSESFPIDDFTAHKDDREGAAQTIFDAFERFNQMHRATTFCNDYARNQRWEDALRNCEQALDMNPTSASTMYQKAFVLWKMERLDDAYEAARGTLEIEPYKDNALQLAGYLATQLGHKDEGREYYGRYLELNPGDIAVRQNIAYDMYNAGDAEGAMLLIEEGLEMEESPSLLTSLGNYAFAAGNAAQSAAEGQEVSPEVAALYQKAIDAYMRVFRIDPTAMDATQLRNVVAAHVQLGEYDEAIAVAEQVLEVHAEEATLWNSYAIALQRAGRIDDAVAALDRVAEIDPEYPDLAARQGNMLIQAGRVDDALPILHRAVENGADANAIARLLFGEAYNKGVTPKNWTYALRMLGEASKFEVSQQQKEELDFWTGYALLQKGIADEAPQTLQTAQATLPMFQRARRLLVSASAYDERQGGRMNLSSLLQAIDQYISIEETIIRRGR